NVYTRPQWRNRRIGADLMEWVKGWALGADLEFLILWPSEDSREFYARAGFVPEAWAVTFELRPYEG
ncbi:MAG: GNAT family N-acetyltransferase, partial [Dehalococcoidia bacterium]